MKKLFLILGMMPLFNVALWAQELHTELLFKFDNLRENQIELDYISLFLQENNLTTNSPDLEKNIMEAHEYYSSHKKEVDFMLKGKELVQFISYHRTRSAAILTQMLGVVATGIQSGIAAGQQQQKEYQKKINREREIQAYIAQNSSSVPKQYTQNFGSTPVMTYPTSRPRVTTSNGFDEPLPSVSQSNSSSNLIGGTDSNERIIQAVYVSGNQLVTCRLRYNSGRIWAYSTSKNPLGQEEWVSIQIPETPTPTMSIRDGDNAKDYKYTISGGGMKFYFNM